MSTDDVSQSERSPNSLTPVQRKQAERRAWWFSNVVIPLALLSICILVPGIAFIQHHRKVESSPIKGPRFNAFERFDHIKEMIAESGPTTQPIPSNADIEQVNLALNQVAAAIEIEQLDRNIARLQTLIMEWDTLYEQTLLDEIGKQVANSEPLLSRFIALQEMRLPESDPAHLNTELPNSLLANLKNSDRAEAMQKLRQAEALEQAWFTYHQTRLQLLRKLRNEAANFSPREITLEEAIASRSSELIANRKAVVDKAAEEAEASLKSKLGELETSLVTQVEIISDLQGQFTKIQNGEYAFNTKPSPAPTTPISRIDYEQELPTIRKTLKPFLTPGYAQPKSSTEMVFGSSKAPMSFSALKRVGALSDTIEGQMILFRIGGSKSAKLSNDRPLGEFPRYDLDTTLTEVPSQVKDAQRLLTVYGLLLVEDRLLSP